MKAVMVLLVDEEIGKIGGMITCPPSDKLFIDMSMIFCRRVIDQWREGCKVREPLEKYIPNLEKSLNDSLIDYYTWLKGIDIKVGDYFGVCLIKKDFRYEYVLVILEGKKKIDIKYE